MNLRPDLPIRRAPKRASERTRLPLPTIALTGGTGFVGAAVIDRLTSDGYALRALARNPDKMRRRHPDIAVVPGGLGDDHVMDEVLQGADALINCAGLTHALTADDFHQVNVDGAAHAARRAARTGIRVVHISSMAARAPSLSAYAQSKFDSEGAVRNAVAHAPDASWCALRLPAVYGPGDQATLPYFRLIKAGLAPEPARTPEGRASILFVADVADAVIAGLNAPSGGVYEVGDGRTDGHSWREIGVALSVAMGRRKPARRLRLPRPILHAYATGVEGVAKITGTPEMLTRGKVAEFFHPDFVAQDNLLSAVTPWRATTPLVDGFAKTVRWYQENKML